MQPSTLAGRFGLMRKALGFKRQADFADAIGRARNSISAYERGTQVPDGETLLRLAQLGVQIQWLLTGDGDMLIGGDAEQPPTAARGAPLDAPDAPSKTVAEQGVMALDAELMGRVVDAIRAVYKAQGQGLPDRTLGEIAARWYGDIAAVSADPGDRLDALAERQIGLRRELRDAATNAASGKQHRA